MNLQEQLVAYRRELHQYPELSMQELETTARLKGWLTEQGIKVLPLPLRVGLVAEIVGTQPGPTIALRSDIDALPIEEQSGVPFASLNPGVMHACGHDVHMAALLGAGILLQQRRDKLAGTVRLLFQPGEEAANGAKWFAAQPGVLEGIEAIFGLHNQPALPVGTIGVREGALMASVDKFEIIINGKGGHGGMPEQCLDPIVTGSQLVSSLQSIVSRRLSSLSNVVVSVTKFQAGNTWNVIPNQAFLEGTVRTFQQEAREKVPLLMKNMCEGIALATGTQIEFIWHVGLPPVVNNPFLAAVAREACEQAGLTAVEAQQNLAGEDFALYLEQIPGCFVWLGDNGPYQWHQPQYIIDEGAISVGAQYLAQLAETVLACWSELSLSLKKE
ncbi:MAG: amidohydrolase [Phascolarctobacterium sp.]